MRAAPAREAGFSLIEVTVAIALLALGLVAAVAAQSGALALSRASRDVAIGAADLASACELIMSVPVSDLESTYPDGAAITAFNGLHLRDESVVVTYPDPSADPIEVRLAIRWRDQSGAFTPTYTAAVMRVR